MPNLGWPTINLSRYARCRLPMPTDVWLRQQLFTELDGFPLIRYWGSCWWRWWWFIWSGDGEMDQSCKVLASGALIECTDTGEKLLRHFALWKLFLRNGATTRFSSVPVSWWTRSAQSVNRYHSCNNYHSLDWTPSCLSADPLVMYTYTLHVLDCNGRRRTRRASKREWTFPEMVMSRLKR